MKTEKELKAFLHDDVLKIVESVPYMNAIATIELNDRIIALAEKYHMHMLHSLIHHINSC